MKKRNALGRGLGALLDDSSPIENRFDSRDPKESVSSINEIPLDYIEVNPFQPRSHFDERALQELADSIKMQGIIQPITVRKLSDKQYQLISGERRLQASKMAGLTAIPAYIRTADDQQMLEMALIENIQRENLNAIEVALSYQRLLSECDLKQEELGDRVGKDRSTVNNYLRLLKLPPDIQAGLRDKKISMGHARALITIDDVSLQLEIFRQILAKDLSVRKVEALVREGNKEKKAPAQPPAENGKEIAKLQGRLSSHFGSRVQVKSSDGKKGEIKIPFVSIDDLNRILDILDM
ncbi:ParB/RepB/Spo0J family partition protein [Fulvivirga sedimenti]|uniref:ParB/RepB/Spo0J family partition protein n=1 Tax=Fulvivirga sedimenti TaxID=2879465 RepID=A0A9X1HLM8_9BACT|nr:ParB/RepB/Spo0J family partition protein [Fulvivirga sedimenti]MCA6073601.1 ParB/RepB/Spo0J family partition protein [Fulvivirga sedimenti]